mmetsp:Transcript_16031/g.29374  ORF Transcript_16031/g.29374 Transcript_16031/m.29374 type:complete len:157 (-) Transcript_16031:33-503(-)|eukprot:CAMPEP_0204912344 /NCGR_PEP_ID=MMETSP1397-20131031/10515_1 /ASSEMBLY_ACC=CAM_ASM_000891 /TAXON_ID=49980 /ORGANISM="Climacostomum Climacostomum virens, Strain Stock W-24" /LENGTH=156 /DNA_ID=CAMNT_0052083261 /DNA_START=277 /DNA_END=744 /DNA_ORIENTATION=-
MSQVPAKLRKLQELSGSVDSSYYESPRKKIPQLYSSESNLLANPRTSAYTEESASKSSVKKESVVKTFASQISTLPGTFKVDTPEKLMGKRLDKTKSHSQFSFASSHFPAKQAKLSRYLKNMTSDDCERLQVKPKVAASRKKEMRTDMYTTNFELV